VFFITISAAGLPDGEDAEEPLGLIFGAIFAFIMSNACYTGGWITQLYLKSHGIVKPRMASCFLKLGMIFSAAVVSIPAVLWTALYVCTWFGYVPFPPGYANNHWQESISGNLDIPAFSGQSESPAHF